MEPPSPSRLLPGAGEHEASRLHNAGAPPARRGIPTLRLSSHAGGTGREGPPLSGDVLGLGGRVGCWGLPPFSLSRGCFRVGAGGTQAVRGPFGEPHAVSRPALAAEERVPA